MWLFDGAEAAHFTQRFRSLHRWASELIPNTAELLRCQFDRNDGLLSVRVVAVGPICPFRRLACLLCR